MRRSGSRTGLADEPRPMRARRLRTRAEAGAESPLAAPSDCAGASVDSAGPTSTRSAMQPPRSIVVGDGWKAAGQKRSDDLAEQRRRGAEHEKHDQEERNE